MPRGATNKRRGPMPAMSSSSVSDANGKKGTKTKGKRSQSGKSRSSLARNALNAFDLAQDEEEEDPYDEVDDLNEDDDGEGGERRDYLSGEVRSEDDEEIDSDEAFGSDDDEDYFMAKKMGKRAKASAKGPSPVLAPEDSDEGYESIDETELVSLSQAWDMDDDASTKSSKSKKTGPSSVATDDQNPELRLRDIEDDSESDSESQLSNAGALSDVSDSSGDQESDSDLDVSDDDSLVDEEELARLRDTISSLDQSSLAKKRRLQVDNSAENEFALPASSKKLSLQDLTSSIDVSDVASQKLAVPLPKRIQERNDRSAAYELTKTELERWNETVSKNRDADNLMFPVNAPPQFHRPAPQAAVEPANDLERKVQGLLQQSSLAEEKSLSTFEELAPSKLSMEEVKRRRNELRYMRELLFREEQKAKRIKKIKSKQYRKVHKKERERLAALNEDSESEDATSHDQKRAEERMSLKHKNTSKWAKRMVSQGFTKDQGTRAEMEEMLRRGDELRQKIQGSDSESDGNANFGEGLGDDEDDAEVRDPTKSGLLGMKFMKDAQATRRRENDVAMEAIRNGDFEYDLDDEEASETANRVINEGRRVFAPGTVDSISAVSETVQAARVEQQENDDQSVVSKLKSSHAKGERGNSKSSKSQSAAFNSEPEANPWDTVDAVPAQAKSKMSAGINRDSSKGEKSQAKLKNQRSQLKSKGESSALIDMNETLSIVDPQASDNEGNDGEQGDDASMVKASKLISFKQMDMVKRAFAGDDVVDEFQQEKRRKTKEEGDQDVDVTVPGWGSWGGSNKKPKKKFTKKVEGIKADKRKDAKLKDVIINEKFNHKASKYNSTTVPYPFETREQYEASLRMPLGQEWTSKDTHQKMVKPRVIVKQGVVIDPIKAPFK